MMDEEKRQSSEIEDWIKELLPDFAADMGIGGGVTLPSCGLSNYNQQNMAIASMTSNNNNPSMWHQHQLSDHNMASNLHHHQLLQNQVVEQASERSNMYQFPMQSNSYPNNLRQHQQVQASLGCHSNQTTMHKSLGRQSSLVPARAQLELLHMSAFHQAQNVTLADQMKHGNQLQTMRLGLGPLQALSESTPQPELTNSIEWMDHAYKKILQMKEMFSPDLLTLYKRAHEVRQSANNAETVNKCEKIRISLERVINFLRMSRSDISRWRKEKLYQTMHDVVKYANQARASNSLAQKQNQRVELNNGVRLENIFQFNNTQPSFNQSSACHQISPMRSMVPSIQKDSQQTGFHQRALEMFLNPTQVNNKNIFGQSDSFKAQNSVTTVSPTLQNKQKNEQAIKRQRNNKQQIVQSKNDEKNSRRFGGLINQRRPKLSAGAISPQNSPQSSSQIELKDLSSPSSSSKFSKSATVSSSAFPSPLTPLTPCSKPADYVKIPLSIDESSKFPQNSSDPVKRLVDAVTSMSPRALNSAIQDIDAITSLKDRIASNFLYGGSTKVVFQDLDDDIRKFRTQSMMEDQMETTNLIQMKTETQFCASGSAKRLKKEPSGMLFQEIKEVNRRFMEVKVDVMNMDDVSRIGFDEDILIRCSYVPVGPASQLMIHKLNLELIVPADYPKYSPTVSEKMSPVCGDSEGKHLWTKAKSYLSLKLRKFSQPITVKQMASAWEGSARDVFLEYAEQMGGGSFSSRYYGNWDSFAVAF